VVTRAEALQWFRLGFQAGAAATARRHTELEWQAYRASAAEFRAQRLADQQARYAPDLTEIIAILAGALLGGDASEDQGAAAADPLLAAANGAAGSIRQEHQPDAASCELPARPRPRAGEGRPGAITAAPPLELLAASRPVTTGPGDGTLKRGSRRFRRNHQPCRAAAAVHATWPLAPAASGPPADTGGAGAGGA
jgi:hypothetical protein